MWWTDRGDHRVDTCRLSNEISPVGGALVSVEVWKFDHWVWNLDLEFGCGPSVHRYD